MDLRKINRTHEPNRRALLGSVVLIASVGGYSLAQVGSGVFWLVALAVALSSWRFILRQPSASLGSLKVDEAHLGQALPGDLKPVTARLMTAINALAQHQDPVWIELAVLKLAQAADDAEALAKGWLVFENTETWRSVYQKILDAPEIDRNRSVAWARTDDYWQDLPGRRSIHLNFELLDRGVQIERLIILGWNLWPPEARLPLPAPRRWIEEQHYRGLAISLVREADLINEPDLVRDFGIYGTRATGRQELDSQSRTVQFQLFFDVVSLRQAEDRWDRLTVYARPYGTLLDSPGQAA